MEIISNIKQPVEKKNALFMMQLKQLIILKLEEVL